MPTVYLDYNIIAKVAGLPPDQHAGEWRTAIKRLSEAGYRFALSAWHGYELAKSLNHDHVKACCDFVEEINPIWLSDSCFVRREEIENFLNVAYRGNAAGGKLPNAAFNQTFSQMWSTFGGEVIVNDSFRHMVQELRSTPGAIDEIKEAAAETPAAILTGREAQKDGRYAAYAPIIDREFYRDLVNPREAGALEFILKHNNEMLSMCPAIAIEDELTRIRVHERFKPADSDAPDLQHALVGVAYCDYFVTDDGMLFEHCRQAAERCDLPCRVHRNPTTIK